MLRSASLWLAALLTASCVGGTVEGPEEPEPSFSETACATTTYEAETAYHSTGGPTSGGWNLWSNGYLSVTHTFAAGPTTLTVTARGQAAAGTWPRMTVSVGGVSIGTRSVTSSSWGAYDFTFTATAGTRDVRVSFDNDYYAGGEDRNLLVDKLVVGCPPPPPACQDTTYEAEAMAHTTGGATSGGWNLWSNGSLTQSHAFAAGPTTLTVIARGQAAVGVWPHMAVSVGGTNVGSASVSSLAWAPYAFTFDAAAGTQQIRVTFDNDYYAGGEDRNLLVDKVVLTCAADPVDPVDPVDPGAAGGTPYPTGVAYRGINRAGMEYGEDWWGWTGQTYFDMPTASQTAAELAYFDSRGMNVIRLPIAWERIQPTLRGPLVASYVSGMMAYIDAATARGFLVVLDLHNYNRYATGAYDSSGRQVSSYTQHVIGDGTLGIGDLADIWVKLTDLVRDNPNVVLNLMNESHDFPRTSNQWFADVNTVIAAIRATGSTQLILVPNSRSSDVTHWSRYSPNGGDTDAAAALAVTDSADNFAFDMHQYDTDPSSCTSYRDLMTEVTDWATSHHRRLFLSEMGVRAGAANGACAVGTLLSYLDAHADVWIGWTPWDLSPYSLTSNHHTADAAPMAWYRSYFIAGFLGN